MTELKFANKQIESIFMGALNATHYTCQGCGKRALIGTTHRVFWEFTVCNDCMKLVTAKRLSFHNEGGWPAKGCDQVFLHCQVCEMPTSSATYRVLDGVTTQLSPNWEVCSRCQDNGG